MVAIRIFSVLMLWFLALSNQAVSTRAQQRRALPADLVMMATLEGADKNSGERIIWVDAATGDIRDFFVDPASPTFRLRPAAWSPNGRFLLITNARVRADNVMLHDLQLCVVTREGMFVTCMEDTPFAVARSINANRDDTARTFTWSADSRLVYYTSDAQGKLRLLEADAMTGATLRVLHEAPINVRGGTLTWMPDLSMIGEEFGAEPYSASKLVPQIIEQPTGNRTALLANPTDMREDRYYSVLLSPVNGYVTALNQTNTDDESLEIMNHAGDVIHKIGGRGGIGTWSGVLSPAWSPDESVLYFLGEGEQHPLGIYGYTLESKQVASVYLKPFTADPGSPEGMIVDFFTVSPDNSAIAGRGRDAPPNGRSQVRVVYFDGTSEALLGRYSQTLFPLWVPPVTP